MRCRRQNRDWLRRSGHFVPGFVSPPRNGLELSPDLLTTSPNGSFRAEKPERKPSRSGDLSRRMDRPFSYASATRGRPAFITANHVLTEMEKTGEYRCVGVSAAIGGFQAMYGRFEDIDVAVIVPETEIKLGED